MTEAERPVGLRRLHADDHPALIELIRRTWYADHPEDCGRIMAEIDWETCLARATEALVASCGDGTPVGVILGRVEDRDRRPLLNRHHGKVSRAYARLAVTRGGARGAATLAGIAAVDGALKRRAVREHGGAYPAEVVLFLIDSSTRGMGVGGRMFRMMMARFRACGVEDYFLFTDTGCDVGFYDHQGLDRVCERAVTEPGGGESTFFVYEGLVPLF